MIVTPGYELWKAQQFYQHCLPQYFQNLGKNLSQGLCTPPIFIMEMENGKMFFFFNRRNAILSKYVRRQPQVEREQHTPKCLFKVIYNNETPENDSVYKYRGKASFYPFFFLDFI